MLGLNIEYEFLYHKFSTMSLRNHVFSTQYLIFALTLIVSLLIRLARHGKSDHICSSNYLKLPPGPRRWPVLGNLLQIGPVPHLGMREFNRKYGPLVYIHIGMVPTVVTDDPKYVKEFLVKQDHAFASRPKNIASDYFTSGGSDIAFAPYGPHWRNLRRICSMELLTPRKIASFREGRNEEIQCMVNEVFEMCREGKRINMRDLFGTLTNNSISRMILGQRYFGPEGSGPEFAAEHKAKIYESFSLVNAFNIGDYLPFLRPFDLQGQEHRLKGIMAWVDKLYADILEEQTLSWKQTHKTGPINFVHTLLSLAASDKDLTMTKIKAILVDMVAAATDTSSTTSEWTITELLRHPQYMKKVREEIDSVVGNERLVQDYDLSRLRLLKAVVKEVFRLHPVGGFLIPHLSMQHTKVGGYDIPRNTRILINTYSLGRNPAVWSDPDEFKPERFLSGEDKLSVDLSDGECRIVPFGAGRRSCPGAGLGSTIVLLGVARLIQLFYWFPANSKEILDDSDMKEAYGYTVKAQPLEAIAKPRLDEPHLYRKPC